MLPEHQKILQDLLENTRKTDRNAVFIAFVLAAQTVTVAYFENRVDQEVALCRAKIELLK